jgi:hypothetical protein
MIAHGHLAELDWQIRSNGETGAQLLDGLWEGIEEAFRTGDRELRPRILDIVRDAAHYQPRRVIRLVEMAVRNPAPDPDGQVLPQAEVQERLPDLLHRCAYTQETLPRCLDLLWELSQVDDRPPEDHNEHPLRVVRELAKYDIHGHWWVNREVARRVRTWFESPEGTRHQLYLLGILDSLLAKVGEDNRSEGHSVRLVAFHLPPSEVQAIRTHAFAVLGRCLDSDDVSLQLRAVKSLEQALNGPMPLFGLQTTEEVLAGWEPDQLGILDLLAGLLARRHPPLVQLRVREAVRFQASNGPRPAVRERACSVAKLVEDSFEVQLTRLLIPQLSYWDFDPEPDEADAEPSSKLRDQRQSELLARVVPELWHRHPTASDAFTYLDETVRSLQQFGQEVNPCLFLGDLLASRAGATEGFIRLALATPESPLAMCLGPMLSQLRRLDAGKATDLAGVAVASGERSLLLGVGHHYGHGWPRDQTLTAADTEVIKSLLAHPDESVRVGGVIALREVARTNATRAAELAISVEVGDSERLAEELAHLTDPIMGGSPDTLPDADLSVFLTKFDQVGRLRPHVCRFLGRVVARLPDEVLDLFLRRVARQEAAGYVSGYRPIPKEVVRVFEPVQGTERQPAFLRRVRDYALGGTYWRRSALPMLFRAIAGTLDQNTLSPLLEWVESGDPNRVLAAVGLLQQVGRAFVFERREFVGRVLDQAAALGPDCFDTVRSSFLRFAFTDQDGMNGRPFPTRLSSLRSGPRKP